MVKTAPPPVCGSAIIVPMACDISVGQDTF
jgi:hypothetical protein